METEQTDELCDEFCSDKEYVKEALDDENSVIFRFVIKDPDLNKNLEVFENQVKETFLNMKVDQSNQCFIVSGYEQLKDESKLFIKVKDNPKVIAAVRNMKSENTFLRKLPSRKTKL